MESTNEKQSRFDSNSTMDGSFSCLSKAMLDLSRQILKKASLADVLTRIAQLVECHDDGVRCSIWLPQLGRNDLYCAVAPSMPKFPGQAGRFRVGRQDGPLNAAVLERQAILTSDVVGDPLWSGYEELILAFNMRSVWIWPLLNEYDQVLGVLALHDGTPHSPKFHDAKWFETISNIASIVIERHRSAEKARVERDRLRLLLEITNSMASKLDFRRLVESLSTDLLRVAQCDFCALLLPNADKSAYQLTTLYNPERRGILCDGMMIPNTTSVCGKPFPTGQALYLENFSEVEKEVQESNDRTIKANYECLQREGFLSGYYLPLLGRNGVIGTLVALNRSERTYEKEETDFLEQAARQVALAVENAYAYEGALKDRDKEAEQKRYLQKEIRAEFAEIVGDSPALKNALDLVSIVAPTDSTTLILGETGTGKELIARAVHDSSSRREQAFIKLNCAAIPLGLLESELFGHEQGAFTGAVNRKVGRFELAHKGSLFLDEVGDIPLELQAKLLRVLQEQEFERLGGTKTHKVDVRLIAATHRDLPAMVKQGTFREDLYYRLKVFPIHVPPLRQRPEDIPRLVNHFLDLHARRMNKRIDEIPSDVMAALMRYRWPGNVRELQNFIERAVILSPHTVLRAPIGELEQGVGIREPSLPLSGLNEVERSHILRALDASGWVVGGRRGAAERLGMKRTSLVYRMQRLGITRPHASSDASRPVKVS